MFQLEGLDAKWVVKQSNGFRRRISLQTFMIVFIFTKEKGLQAWTCFIVNLHLDPD